MNYELAKELKDAGFPQHGYEMMTPHAADVKLGRESVYYPTLSELIEACLKELDGELTVRFKDGKCVCRYKEIEFVGSTPKEAVARLWLALNKKI